MLAARKLWIPSAVSKAEVKEIGVPIGGTSRGPSGALAWAQPIKIR